MIVCNKCKIEKDDSDYYPRNKVCKECTKKRVSEYQKSDKGKEVHRQANKKYNQTGQAKERRKIAEQKYLALPTTKKKQLAKWAVKRAVKAGILVKEPCKVCGRLNVHAHHPDYDKQLDIDWLCPEHHHAWHEEHGEGKNAT